MMYPVFAVITFAARYAGMCLLARESRYWERRLVRHRRKVRRLRAAFPRLPWGDK